MAVHGEGAAAEGAAAAQPLPWSADDINPSPLIIKVTEWLPGSFMPGSPPKGCAHASWPPAAAKGAGPSAPAGHRPSEDDRRDDRGDCG
jgi:hypothetical protein